MPSTSNPTHGTCTTCTGRIDALTAENIFLRGELRRALKVIRSAALAPDGIDRDARQERARLQTEVNHLRDLLKLASSSDCAALDDLCIMTPMSATPSHSGMSILLTTPPHSPESHHHPVRLASPTRVSDQAFSPSFVPSSSAIEEDVVDVGPIRTAGPQEERDSTTYIEADAVLNSADDADVSTGSQEVDHDLDNPYIGFC